MIAIHVIAFGRCGLQAISLRAHMWLGEAKRTEHLAARQRLQVFLLLRLIAPSHEN